MQGLRLIDLQITPRQLIIFKPWQQLAVYQAGRKQLQLFGQREQIWLLEDLIGYHDGSGWQLVTRELFMV